MNGQSVFIFPGQGSQFVGMGKSLFESFPEAKERYQQADEIMGTSLSHLSFEGPEEQLKQTRFTQPAIFVHSVVMDGLLKARGITPGATAGHSLGEYSALVSAGALSFEDGLKLVKIRGELMQASGERNPGTMAAILGLSGEEVAAVCEAATEDGVVKPANFNSPGQVVISGEVYAVHAAMALAKEKGAKLVKELEVSGAFHSPLMAEALAGLEAALANVALEQARVPVYSNVEAQPVSDPESIRQLLRRQLMSPVRWEDILRNLIADGFKDFYEVGPGRVLQGLLKRTDRQYLCQPAGTPEDLAALQDAQ